MAIFPFISLSQPFFKRQDGFAFDDGQASFIQSKITDIAFVQSLNLLVLIYLYVYVYHITLHFFIGLPYYMSAVLAPLLGFVIDRIGRNTAWVMFSCVATLVAHCLLAIQSSQALAYVAMVILGVGYSTLASSLWPIIALVVPLHRQGTAFGKKHYLKNLKN